MRESGLLAGILALSVVASGGAAFSAPVAPAKEQKKAVAAEKPKQIKDAGPFNYTVDADKDLPNHNCRAIFAWSSRGAYYRNGPDLLAKARNEGESKAFILMAQSCLQIGQKSYNTGFDLAKQALALAPGEAMIQAQMGWAYMFKEDDKRAREWFLKAATNAKADFSTLGSLSAGFKELDDLDGRLVVATSMVKKYPQYMASVHDMTMALVDLRRFREAEPYAKKALAMNPNTREACFGMCEVDRGLSRWRESIKDCDAVTACGFSAQSRKSVVVLRYKAEAYENLHEWKNAIAAWTVAIDKTPDTRQYFVHRGDCYKKLGDIKRAQADYDKAKELDSGLD